MFREINISFEVIYPVTGGARILNPGLTGPPLLLSFSVLCLGRGSMQDLQSRIYPRGEGPSLCIVALPGMCVLMKERVSI